MIISKISQAPWSFSPKALRLKNAVSGEASVVCQDLGSSNFHFHSLLAFLSLAAQLSFTKSLPVRRFLCTYLDFSCVGGVCGSDSSLHFHSPNVGR
jgi:hypothetical protein